jgi:hypothetical protein
MVRDFTSIDDISEPTPLQADVEALEAWTGFRPRTSVVERLGLGSQRSCCRSCFPQALCCCSLWPPPPR